MNFKIGKRTEMLASHIEIRESKTTDKMMDFKGRRIGLGLECQKSNLVFVYFVQISRGESGFRERQSRLCYLGEVAN